MYKVTLLTEKLCKMLRKALHKAYKAFYKPLNETSKQEKIFDFLKEVEGNEYTAYVPPVGNSGVTIGIGVDLGSINFSRASLPKDVYDKIKIYYGFKRNDAVELLEAKPLDLSRVMVDYISQVAISTHQKELEFWFDRESEIPFRYLTLNQKKVLMSVKYQYGDIRRRTPKFWLFATRGDWQAVYDELMDFGDAFPTRRRKEAALIKKDLGDK